MHPRRRRTQKAGYKYLRNRKRGTWVNALESYGNQIVSQIPQIQWSSFSYRGPVECLRESYTVGGGGTENISHIDDTFEGVARSKEDSYEVFGGAACELWATAFPTPPIREFVDPTGDIDVYVVVPFVQAVEDSDGIYDDPDVYLFKSGSGLTELGDQYSRWLFNEVVRVFSPLAPFFDKPEFSVPSIGEDDELGRADIAEMYGNLLFTRMAHEDSQNVKVQMSVKVTTGNIAVVNHLLEFLLPKRGQHYKMSAFQIRTIRVAEPWKLFTGQIKGLADRGGQVLKYWNIKPARRGRANRTPMFYKVDNHCGRILYLTHLLLQTTGKVWQQSPLLRFQTVTGTMLGQEIAKLYKTKTVPMCEFHFYGFARTLFSLFEKFPGVKVGAFTNATSPIRTQFKTLLHRGGSKTRKHLRGF